MGFCEFAAEDAEFFSRLLVFEALEIPENFFVLFFEGRTGICGSLGRAEEFLGLGSEAFEEWADAFDA